MLSYRTKSAFAIFDIHWSSIFSYAIFRIQILTYQPLALDFAALAWDSVRNRLQLISDSLHYIHLQVWHIAVIVIAVYAVSLFTLDHSHRLSVLLGLLNVDEISSLIEDFAFAWNAAKDHLGTFGK